MTRWFGFYGASDDLFIVNIDGQDSEEIYPPQQYLLTSPDGGRMVVTAHYGDREGVWSIGVEPFDEDVDLPSWLVELSLARTGYSTFLSIGAPDDTDLSVINRLD